MFLFFATLTSILYAGTDCVNITVIFLMFNVIINCVKTRTVLMRLQSISVLKGKWEHFTSLV